MLWARCVHGPFIHQRAIALRGKFSGLMASNTYSVLHRDFHVIEAVVLNSIPEAVADQVEPVENVLNNQKRICNV
jgi:hypothetical protein